MMKNHIWIQRETVCRNFFFFVISSLFLLNLFSVITVAQCDGLMKFGVHDKYEKISESQQFRLFKTWVCESKFSDFASARSAAANLGIGYEVFDLKLGGQTAENNWQTWSSNFCQTNYEEVKNNYVFKDRIKVISPTLMKVISECIRTQDRGKFYGWIETSRDRSVISFKAKYLPVGNERAVIEDIAFTPPSIRQNCQPLRVMSAGRIITPAGKTITCRVDPKQTIAITLNTTQGEASPILDKVEDPIPIPTINSFTVNDTDKITITKGEKATLKWSVSNAAALRIEPLGDVSGGTLEISPNSTTTYTLVAIGSSGAVLTKQVVVTVNMPAPTATFTASKETVYYGQATTLSWDTKDAVAVFIDQGIGQKDPKGSITVNPTSNITYKLSAIGITEPKAIKEITISVTPKVIVYKDYNKGGGSVGINSDTNYDGEGISSVEVFTDEWVQFIYERTVCRRTGRLNSDSDDERCETKYDYLYIKGPGYVSNLHAYGKNSGGNWGDVIQKIRFGVKPSYRGGESVIEQAQARVFSLERNTPLIRTFQAYAAPSIWGPWVTVAEHLGVVTYKITAEPVGDTIIRGNVRYFKTDNTQVVEEWRGETTITTGNSVSKVEVRFIGIPLGSAVNGTISP